MPRDFAYLNPEFDKLVPLDDQTEFDIDMAGLRALAAEIDSRRAANDARD